MAQKREEAQAKPEDVSEAQFLERRISELGQENEMQRQQIQGLIQENAGLREYVRECAEVELALRRELDAYQIPTIQNLEREIGGYKAQAGTGGGE